MGPTRQTNMDNKCPLTEKDKGVEKKQNKRQNRQHNRAKWRETHTKLEKHSTASTSWK